MRLVSRSSGWPYAGYVRLVVTGLMQLDTGGTPWNAPNSRPGMHRMLPTIHDG